VTRQGPTSRLSAFLSSGCPAWGSRGGSPTSRSSRTSINPSNAATGDYLPRARPVTFGSIPAGMPRPRWNCAAGQQITGKPVLVS
jgi:hypothetical protein